MSIYILDIMHAAVAFPFVAMALTVPYLIYQYRKLGSVPWFYTLIVFSFIFYIICAYFLVLFPLPADHSVVVPGADKPRLIPFNSFSDVVPVLVGDASILEKIKGVLLSSCMVQYVFNILLLMPLGMYLRYYFKAPMPVAVGIAFCVSLSFELLQLTGILGLYEHPYRFCDVDDLIANTLGATLGYMIAGPLTAILPKTEKIDRKAREAGERVSVTRRALSFAIDFWIIDFCVPVVLVMLSLLVSPFVPTDSSAVFDAMMSPLNAVLMVIAFAVVPAFTHGQTLGQKILKIYVARMDGSRAPWYLCAARYGLLFAFVLAPMLIVQGVIAMVKHSAPGSEFAIAFLSNNYQVIIAIVTVVMALWAVSLAVRAFRSWKNKSSFVMLNGLVTQTRVLVVQ